MIAIQIEEEVIKSLKRIKNSTEVEEFLDKGHMKETAECFLPSEVDQEAIINQEAHAEDRTTIEIEGDSRQQRFRGQSIFLASRLKIAIKSPSRDKDRYFSCRQFDLFVRQ